MPWTTITAPREDIDEEIATFEGTVTSIDNWDVAGHGHNRVTAVIEYSA
jgi:hypothetical protein